MSHAADVVSKPAGSRRSLLTWFSGATAVKFNGTSAGFSSLTDTQFVTVVPFGASTGPLTVTTPVVASML